MDKIIEEDVLKIAKNLQEFKSKISGQTFLVTGGAGFLGSWFCDVLDFFEAKIICVDNLVTGSKENIKQLIGKPNFRFIQHDITKPLEIDGEIDYVINMASIASPPVYQKFPIETLNTNILGTIHLLDFARSKNVKAFLFTSTSEVYGDPPEEKIPTPETFPGLVSSFGPRAMYDEGKRAAEAYLYSYDKEFGKPPIRIARIFNTYGPRLDVKETAKYGRALMKFIIQALKNQPMTIYNQGKQTRSFCYITDQVEGLFRLLLTPNIDGEIFNIGNENEISILELTKILIEKTKSKSIIQQIEKTEYNVKGDPMRRCPDISKAKEVLGYNPKVPLEYGLLRTADWVRQNL